MIVSRLSGWEPTSSLLQQFPLSPSLLACTHFSPYQFLLSGRLFILHTCVYLRGPPQHSPYQSAQSHLAFLTQLNCDSVSFYSPHRVHSLEKAQNRASKMAQLQKAPANNSDSLRVQIARGRKREKVPTR